MGAIITTGDSFSYTVTSVECMKAGHTGGSAPLSNAGQSFVTINGQEMVCKGASNTSNCGACGYTMTIIGVPQDYVTINGVPVAATTSSGSGNSCHSCLPISASFQSFVVIN